MIYLSTLSRSSAIKQSREKPQSRLRLIALISTLFFAFSGLAAADGPKGPKGEQVEPSADDPSAWGPEVYGDLPEGLEDANIGAFEGGLTGTPDDPAINNIVSEEDQRADNLFFNIPTNGRPSPLYGAQPFTQSMLRFEEFGPQKLKKKYKKNEEIYLAGIEFPAPDDTVSGPDGDDLDDYLTEQIYPLPTKFSNTTDTNPWQGLIENYLGRPLDNPPAEGRPPGLGWSHQRWNEFTPEVAFKTAQAGARENSGFRDDLQRHGGFT